jgi:hypothetical protein
MRIAVIYTGEVRTIETTIDKFKENVLLNDDINVFAILKSNNQQYYENLIKSKIGNNLKYLNWLDENDNEWIKIRNNSLHNIINNIGMSWVINYLMNSGSMEQYYQMYLAYKQIELYENTNNYKYDYILRFRPDTVLKDKLHFNFTDENYIKQLLEKLKLRFDKKEFLNKDLNLSNGTKSHLNINSFNYIMSCLLFDNRIDYIEHKDLDSNFLDDKDINYSSENEFINSIISYLINGRYIIILRKDIIYFMPRILMKDIHLLGITYGNYFVNFENHWWNAESQLFNICIKYDIEVYNSTTELEHISVGGNYEHNIYYSNYSKNEIKDDKFSFFIKRK